MRNPDDLFGWWLGGGAAATVVWQGVVSYLYARGIVLFDDEDPFMPRMLGAVAFLFWPLTIPLVALTFIGYWALYRGPRWLAERHEAEPTTEPPPPVRQPDQGPHRTPPCPTCGR